MFSTYLLLAILELQNAQDICNSPVVDRIDYNNYSEFFCRDGNMVSIPHGQGYYYKGYLV